MTTQGGREGVPARGKPARDFSACAFLLLLFSFFFFPVLFEDKTFFFRDILSFAYPMKRVIWESFGSGALPLWWPNIFCGVPFLALMEPGVFYPLNFFFLLDDFTTAFNLFLLSQHLLLMFSVYLLARFWGFSVSARLMASITALLGAYFLSLASLHNHFQSAVWFPLVFLFFLKFMDTGRVRHYTFWVLALTAQILGGSPENCIFTVALIAAYSLVVVSPDTRISRRGSRLAFLGAGALLALGLSAVQLLPTYSLLTESVRSEGIPFDDLSVWSLDLGLFSTFFAPAYPAGLTGPRPPGGGYFIPSAYMGILPAFFLLSGLFLTAKKEVRFWIGTFWIGVFFASGRHNPLFEFFYHWVPMFDRFRFPQKFLFLSAFSLVFLAGHGTDRMIEAGSWGKPLRRTFPILVAATAGFLFVVKWRVPQAGLLHSGTLLLLFGAAAYLFGLGKLRPVIFKGLVLVIVLADLSLKNTLLVPLIDRNFYKETPQILKKAGTQNQGYRVFSGPLAGTTVAPKEHFPRTANLLFDHLSLRERLYPNLGTIHNIAYADGLLGLELLDPFLWTEILLKSPPEKRRRLLKRSNVKYWVTDEDALPPTPARPLGMKKTEVFDDVLPRAFLVSRARLGREPQLVNTFLSESFDPRSAVLASDIEPLNSANGFAGSIEDIAYAPNRVTVNTRQTGEGILVLLDSYFPGWTVTVDGRKDRIFRADHFFRGVRLGPGRHVVEFEFVPRGFRAGVLVSAFSLLLLLSVSTLARFSKTFFRTGPSPAA